MSQSIQTYDLWRRDWIRLLVGFTVAGFGCALCIGLLQNPGPTDRPEDRWIVYAVSSMGIIPGILIISLRRLVMLDAIRRQLLRQMREVPFLLLPASGVAAFPHRQHNWETPTKTIRIHQHFGPDSPRLLHWIFDSI